MLLRTLVSKKKRRLVEGGFNLDLTYITPRLIAMGFPAARFEALYRNDASDVVRFLEERHGLDNVFVFNLCCERQYDTSLFGGRVRWVPLRDHNPPPLHVIMPFCRGVRDWLEGSEKRVVAVHCKAGKGRTGVMISCYLLFAGLAASPQEAMDLFGRQRTVDGRGITIPSQMRYVRYFYRLLQAERVGRAYLTTPLRLLGVELRHVAGWEGALTAEIHGHGAGDEWPLARSEAVRLSAFQGALRLAVDAVVSGDAKIEIWTRRHALLPRELLCRVWFNTWVVADAHCRSTPVGTVTWWKKSLDLACSDAKLPEDASVQLQYSAGKDADGPPPR